LAPDETEGGPPVVVGGAEGVVVVLGGGVVVVLGGGVVVVLGGGVVVVLGGEAGRLGGVVVVPGRVVVPGVVPVGVVGSGPNGPRVEPGVVVPWLLEEGVEVDALEAEPPFDEPDALQPTRARPRSARRPVPSRAFTGCSPFPARPSSRPPCVAVPVGASSVRFSRACG
jgi:hypothetical protein